MSRDYKNREEQLMRRTARPLTPGQVAAEMTEELGLTQTELARRLGVSRVTVNELFNNRRSLTPDMAQRLGRFFGDGAAIWMRMQATVICGMRCTWTPRPTMRSSHLKWLHDELSKL